MKKKIILDRHKYTEPYGTSVYYLYSSLDDILSNSFDVIRVDTMYKYYNYESKIDYLNELLECEMAVLWNTEILSELRERGWKGRVVIFALGDLPRGIVRTRSALPYLTPNDVIVVSSQADKDIYHWFVAEGGPRIKIIHFGIDIEWFKPLSLYTRRSLRKKLGYLDCDKVILYCGRITIEKNVHSLLEVFSSILQKSKDYYLIIIGRFDNTPFKEFNIQCDIKQTIENCIQVLGIPTANIKILPYVERRDLANWYNVADVLFNLTLHHDENFGYAQVEAMSCGTPVISTEWGGIKDTVKHNHTGYLIPTWVTENGIRFDRYSAKETLMSLLENNELRIAFKMNARQWVVDQFSMQKFSTELTKICTEVRFAQITNVTRLSKEGYKFSFRFSEKRFHEGIMYVVHQYPYYNDYNDTEYRNLIRFYTSNQPPQITANCMVYKGSYWLQTNRNNSNQITVCNKDPLWPSNVELFGIDAEIAEFVFENEVLNINNIFETWGQEVAIDSIKKLINSGILGISSVE